jgi:hypothetical protein
MTRRPHRATGQPRGRPRGATGTVGWRIRLWLHHHGLLEAMRLPPAGPKSEAAFRAAIAAGIAPELPRSTARCRPRGRPPKSCIMEGQPHVR